MEKEMIKLMAHKNSIEIHFSYYRRAQYALVNGLAETSEEIEETKNAIEYHRAEFKKAVANYKALVKSLMPTTTTQIAPCASCLEVLGEPEEEIKEESIVENAVEKVVAFVQEKKAEILDGLKIASVAISMVLSMVFILLSLDTPVTTTTTPSANSTETTQIASESNVSADNEEIIAETLRNLNVTCR